MASQNERQRWERWYDQVMSRMERQKASIVRLVTINTESMAALEEIASGYSEELSPSLIAEQMRARAIEALGRIKGSAAPEQVESVESIEAETPVEDPRRKHG